MSAARPTTMSAPQSTPQQQQQAQQAQQAILAQQGGQAAASGNMATLMQTMPQLLQLAKQGALNETQLAQLKNLARLYGQQATFNQYQQQQQQPPQPPVPQAGRAPTTTTPPQQPAQPPAAAPTPVAGQKRKSPMPEATNSFNTIGSMSYAQGTIPAVNAQTPSYSLTTPLTVTNPGPQSWPNAAGPRPTLSQGLAAGSSMMGLPTYVTKAPDTIDALGALNEGYKKGTASAVNDPAMRRTVKDLIASIDPTVKVDKEVEDMLLDMADEFIDSVTNFACRLAKHRGSDVLDVKDLQLHLERNHNIRIPGFSSDETRLAISHSNPSTGGQVHKAPKTDPSASAAKKPDGDKDKASKDVKNAKGKANKAKEVQGSAALRAARVAAVRAVK